MKKSNKVAYSLILVLQFLLLQLYQGAFAENDQSFLQHDNKGLIMDSIYNNKQSKEEFLNSIGIQYRTYISFPWGLSIKYPSNWYIEEGGYYFADVPGLPSLCFPNIVSFSPTKTGLDFGSPVVSFRLNLIADFAHRILGGELTLPGYITLAYDLYKTNIPDFNPIHLDFDSTLGGLPAYKMVYTSDDGKYWTLETGTIIKIRDRNVVHQDVYQINYIAPQREYFRYLPLVNEMIGSVKIGGPHTIPTLDITGATIQYIDYPNHILKIEHNIAHVDCEIVPR